jgi:class 3 adenylate cyclase/pimeloyl-ACP methyl ester carboxylesterase
MCVGLAEWSRPCATLPGAKGADVHEVCFAQLKNGREVAYRVESDADGPTIVHLFSGTAPIEVLSDDPMYDRFLRTLGRYGRLITFDSPGIGASDAFDPDRPLPDQIMEAYLAILDAVDVPSAWVVQKGGSLAHLLAVRHRDRIDGAVVLAGMSPPRLIGRRAGLEKILARGPAGRELESVIPSRAEDPAYRAWYERAGRLGATATGARAFYEGLFGSLVQLDWNLHVITDPLPTAIVHRREACETTLEDCQWWLDQFPGSELILVDGVDEFVEGLDAGSLADSMGTFITGERVIADYDRPLVAVMFCDLVDSTRKVHAEGDADWKSMLDRYERHLAIVVDRHHGTLIKYTGDGGLATFPSGSRALSAALDLREGTRRLGLDDRIGIHVGEIERRQDDIGGLAVHLAARVMGVAQPGQILVTSTLAQSTIGGGVRLSSTGTHDLKGFDQSWELLAIEADASRQLSM